MAGVPALRAEVESLARVLDAPAARLVARGETRLLRLGKFEATLASQALIVDACRHAMHCAGETISLEPRPALFALLFALAESWPGAATRAALLRRAFRAKHADESHRARLRVEIGRLRKALVALAPPSDDAHADVLALLADGEAWSSSALALALGASPRTAQRALEALIDVAPEVALLDIDLHERLSQVPSTVSATASLSIAAIADLGGEYQPKSVPLEAPGLVADVDAALGQRVLEVAERDLNSRPTSFDHGVVMTVDDSPLAVSRR